MVQSKEFPVDVVACEFEQAVIDVLTEKTLKAASSFGVKSILMGGGVSANRKLRETLKQKSDIPVFFPELKYCGDNAAYIASAAYFNHKTANFSDIVPQPSLSITD
jgi:N6-L-threonylcarbamoyladenine synthase